MMLNKSKQIFVLPFLFCLAYAEWKPCQEMSQILRYPCQCKVDNLENAQSLSVHMNCDGVVFTGEAQNFPKGLPIVSFSQKHSGHQVLESQAFDLVNLPVKYLDFSANSIQKLKRNAFYNVKDTLIQLSLRNNSLGDTINPIFSTTEFHYLKKLQVLDLSENKIKSIEEGLLRGCNDLEELYLDENYLINIPKGSINGPTNLRKLSLNNNNIVKLEIGSFVAQPNLTVIDLGYNKIKIIEGGAFHGLKNINSLIFRYNKISTLNSDVFKGIFTLKHLDLSMNFIKEFPTVALINSVNLVSLNLSGNMIQKLNYAHLQHLEKLQMLDLSRNEIKTIPTGTFRSLRQLQYLDLSLNFLRTIEDDALEGLQNLKILKIRDNNILLVPGSALGRLPSLIELELDYNRIAALSSDILGSIDADITHLSLSRNLIRELPAESFEKFKNLEYIDLSGNTLALTSGTFKGLETSLRELILSQNKITAIVIPFNLMNLEKLDLSNNKIEEFATNSFDNIKSLKHLNMSGNAQLHLLFSRIFKPLRQLEQIDFSKCNIKKIPAELFTESIKLQVIKLQFNLINELNERTFRDLKNISYIDLSYNNITSIQPSTFVNVMTIKYLSLKGNNLKVFRGEIFNTGTSLEEIDISENKIKHLYTSSFRIHPRLKKIQVSKNKLSLFPPDLVLTLQYLEEIDVSGNQLKTIDELHYARLPNLRNLNLAHNYLESLNEMAFHNSSQLQHINLSFNRIDRIGERTFEGLLRLQCLNLEGNRLTELHETLFENSRVKILENINLARNSFVHPPWEALEKQSSYLYSVDMSNNLIKDISENENVLINVKKLDLSFNPLTNESINNILSQPKTVRELSLAGTGIVELKSIETPFLRKLNLSYNQLSGIDENFFERTTLLETLDLSHNLLKDLEKLSASIQKLKQLKNLNLSNNTFEIIMESNFQNLESLSCLKIAHLSKCTRIEKNVFKNLINLAELNVYDLPLLGYLDIQGILELLPGLHSIDIEVKDPIIGTDQIQLSKHPRLTTLSLRGKAFRNVSAGILAGLKSNELTFKLRDTSIMSLPNSILVPVPRSTHLNIDVTGSKLTALSSQFLSAFEDRRGSIKFIGLNSNPIHCDCNARALRRWLPLSQMLDVKCQTPKNLENKYLVEVGDDKLTCPTTTSNPLTHKFISKLEKEPQTPEPIIFWELESTSIAPKKKSHSPLIKQSFSNDITLIIGIVGGVVAFIALLIIVICIIRLKLSNSNYQDGPIIVSPFAMNPANNMQINYNGQQPSPYCLQSQNISPNLTSTLTNKSLYCSQHNLSQGRPASTITSIYSPPMQQQQYVNYSEGQKYIVYQDEKKY